MKDIICAGILTVSLKTGKFLLLERSDGKGFSTVGGHEEDFDENIMETAMREFREETKFHGKISLKKFYVQENKNFKYYTYLGFVTEEFKPLLNRENQSFKWFTATQLMKYRKLLHTGLIELIKEKGYELLKLDKIIKKQKKIFNY